ncbi:SKI family transcriptional corepressor 2 isoform X1 [Scyliorhinus canicula]|uniref:SKI family transcriptional corepressor 2 isoform X1 n=1 Tax=Scyliorhinus canicula TaxID=7830 RepID=UPI0018F3856B|nr:SKI family transcriptional corepressor 2 isoform X1 [Scyliorhinus canicula]XP_038646407.1 SKI family transcriptional corepressor 2 isoform X1 [Scyliorhinus canicula]XP_038646408.1 SKI family transcriptional corepressor 2 isoform X1 [Scyliorhinus canicula]XP_038646409.1 SKI family transcriptional corepressor 2 isoform X1 [Scyliorhinus canicula]
MDSVSTLPAPTDDARSVPASSFEQDSLSQQRSSHLPMKPNQVGRVILYGVPIVSLIIDNQERLCLAQISNTLLKNYSYNEIHNRRVALGITCVQCTPVQLEILRRAGAMPISSRRCGMITKREAERLCKSFLGENKPPKLPDNFAFDVSHECAWGSRGSFIPARYNSSRAKCIKCTYCSMYFSPNKFIFHSHRTPEAKYTQPDAANFNSWRRHLRLTDKSPPQDLAYAWEDVKAMFNGGSRKRALPGPCGSLGSMKAVNSVITHMMGPDLSHKRARFAEDAEDGSSASSRKNMRSYPVIPVPSKGFGMLQKFPAASLFPNPYTFPAFGLCQKKDDGDSLAGEAKQSGLSGLLWPGRKDAFYPPLCMFWPPRAANGIPVPTYLQPQPSALTTVGGETPTLRQTFLDLADQSDAGGLATARDSLFDRESLSNPGTPDHSLAASGRVKLLDVSAFTARKQSYLSAFRPVVKDIGSIAKLHGNVEDFGSERHPSPGTSSSYHSDSVESEEEQEVDVETNKLSGDGQEEAISAGQYTPNNPQPQDSSGFKGSKDKAHFCSSKMESSKAEGKEDPTINKGPIPCDPASLEQPAYKDGLKNGTKKHSLYSKKDEDSFSIDGKQQDCFTEESDSSGVGFWRESGGDQAQESTSPLPVKTDVENMEKEELQKVLLEQIDLRRRLEQEFQALKGSASFTVVNNFQEQMKRELAYREEMVQQLQMIPYAASLMRKERLNTQMNKS